jgi:HK97 family phage prohead protease
MKPIERRIVDARIEVRDTPDGKVGLRGYAAVFNVEAHGELIRSAAFNRTLAQRDDVRLLVNHDGVAIARTKSGTMSLSVDELGLVVDVEDLDLSNPTVQELVSAMRRGDIDQMSFAFIAHDAPTVDGVRELRELSLVDVSVVTYPWYDVTTAGLTGDRDVDRVLVSARSLSPDQRAEVLAELTDPATDEVAGMIVVDETPAPEPVRTFTIAEARALLPRTPAA